MNITQEGLNQTKMASIEVRVVNQSNNPLPQYETEGAAGMDVRAKLDSSVFLEPGERVLIKTGLYVEIPKGYEIQVRPRSGLAFKNGITVLNSPGTIDSDYRGEIGVILINHDDNGNTFTINNGDRIGQLVLKEVEKVVWKPVLVLSDTARGEGGYNSTGIR
jgi:dUTP pyrophosphatase